MCQGLIVWYLIWMYKLVCSQYFKLCLDIMTVYFRGLENIVRGCDYGIPAYNYWKSILYILAHLLLHLLDSGQVRLCGNENASNEFWYKCFHWTLCMGVCAWVWVCMLVRGEFWFMSKCGRVRVCLCVCVCVCVCVWLTYHSVFVGVYMAYEYMCVCIYNMYVCVNVWTGMWVCWSAGNNVQTAVLWSGRRWGRRCHRGGRQCRSAPTHWLLPAHSHGGWQRHQEHSCSCATEEIKAMDVLSRLFRLEIMTLFLLWVLSVMSPWRTWTTGFVLWYLINGNHCKSQTADQLV